MYYYGPQKVEMLRDGIYQYYALTWLQPSSNIECTLCAQT